MVLIELLKLTTSEIRVVALTQLVFLKHPISHNHINKLGEKGNSKYCWMQNGLSCFENEDAVLHVLRQVILGIFNGQKIQRYPLYPKDKAIVKVPQINFSSTLYVNQ